MSKLGTVITVYGVFLSGVITGGGIMQYSTGTAPAGIIAGALIVAFRADDFNWEGE